MNATGLPITTVSTNVPSTAAAEASPVAGSNNQAPTDFMMALAQMIGASVPTTGVEAQIAAAAGESEADTDSSDEATALASLPLPIAQMQSPLAAPLPTQQADPLELLGLNPKADGASARDAALLQAMMDRLAAMDESSQPLETQAQNAPVLPSIDTQQPVRTTADGAITRPVHVPVGTPAWAEEIGSRLTLMTEKGQHTASLRMSPEHLGPLEVRISMQDDRASVWFGAAHADTRAAIEQALPRLREMFAAQGMSLTDAGVFREPPRQQMPTFANNANASPDGANAEPVSAAAQVKIGLLDAYA
jgi:flagellar hook-length control protein FliK